MKKSKVETTKIEFFLKPLEWAPTVQVLRYRWISSEKEYGLETNIQLDFHPLGLAKQLRDFANSLEEKYYESNKI